MTKNSENNIILSTPRFDVVHDKVNGSNGFTKDFYYIKKQNAAGVILVNKNNIGLVKIKRHILQESFYEIIGGRIENEEEPIESAKRELFEEVGLKSNNWKFLNIIYPLPSVTTEKVFLFMVEVSIKQISMLETGEGIEEFDFYSKKKILELIVNNQINNSVDGFALLYYLNFKKRF